MNYNHYRLNASHRTKNKNSGTQVSCIHTQHSWIYFVYILYINLFWSPRGCSYMTCTLHKHMRKNIVMNIYVVRIIPRWKLYYSIRYYIMISNNYWCDRSLNSDFRQMESIIFQMISHLWRRNPIPRISHEQHDDKLYPTDVYIVIS